MFIYDPKYPEEIPGEWYGSHKPSPLRRNLIHTLFYTTFQTTINYISENKNSKECETIRNFLKFSKSLHQPNITYLRQVFLGIVCPPRNPFQVSIISLSHINIYQINSFNHRRLRHSTVLYIHGGGFVSGNLGGFKVYDSIHGFVMYVSITLNICLNLCI